MAGRLGEPISRVSRSSSVSKGSAVLVSRRASSAPSWVGYCTKILEYCFTAPLLPEWHPNPTGVSVAGGRNRTHCTDTCRPPWHAPSGRAGAQKKDAVPAGIVDGILGRHGLERVQGPIPAALCAKRRRSRTAWRQHTTASAREAMAKRAARCPRHRRAVTQSAALAGRRACARYYRGIADRVGFPRRAIRRELSCPPPR
jgi:hypothetical protein